MRYGRTVPEGFLPVYSVDTEEEAQRLLVATCGTNYEGEFVARELIEGQTLRALCEFGERLADTHARIRK